MLRISKFVSVAVVLLALAPTALPQVRTYPANDQNVRQLLTRIQNRTNNLRQNLFRISDWRQRQELTRLIQDFDTSVGRVQAGYNTRRRNNNSDVQLLLDRASEIDNALSRYQTNRTIANIWDNVRADVSALANAFGLSWSSGGSNYPNQPPYRQNLLTGTFRLDPSRSDNPSAVADRATQGLSVRDRDRIRQRLITRLDSPDQIAIDRRGRTITIASSKAPQITFEADGSERIEATPNGRTIRARATLTADQLMVTTTGNRDTQFTVTFDPINNGDRLNVTRRVYLEGLDREVSVQSVYNRTDDVARFDIYNGGSQTYPNDSDFIVRDGETVVAVLNDPLSTRTVREGDRFTLTVREPARLAGATIEGHLSDVQRSGRLTGRSQMTLNFDSIRSNDGRSYRFAGIVQLVRTAEGDTVRVDNEGAIRDSNQTSKTAERTAIGTAIGAIIGAIAGGGKGAAIGAVVGAGGGAGSVYVQGRDDLELNRGTELTIRASAPR
jgi:hypothetical protein